MKYLFLAVLLAGCAPIHAWERDRLVSPVMLSPADDLEAAFDVHVVTSREAVRGAEGGGGASCGCD